MDPDPLLRAAALQRGIVTRQQATAAGLSRGAIEHRLRSGRWQRVAPAVFRTHAGAFPREAEVIAAVLAAGRGAVASHHTAAELWDLRTTSRLIHVTVPFGRLPANRPGVVVHRSRHLSADDVILGSMPPQTTVGRTVIDVLGLIVREDEAIALVADAVQRRRISAARLAARIAASQVRHRRLLLDVLRDVADGAHSLLEVRFRRLQRAHGLPRGRLQVAVSGDLVDVADEEFRIVTELDGRLGHDDFQNRHRDMGRDNRHALDGWLTLRFGWADVVGDPCGVAALYAAALTSRGWRGTPRPCAGSCLLGRAPTCTGAAGGPGWASG